MYVTKMIYSPKLPGSRTAFSSWSWYRFLVLLRLLARIKEEEKNNDGNPVICYREMCGRIYFS